MTQVPAGNRLRLPSGGGTFARGYEPAAGTKEIHNEVAGRSRGGLSTKIHFGTNQPGLPLAAEITPSEVSDHKACRKLLDADEPPAQVLLADHVYDSDTIRQDLEARGIVEAVPARKIRRVRKKADGRKYAPRNRIERCFNRLKNSRRMAA